MSSSVSSSCSVSTDPYSRSVRPKVDGSSSSSFPGKNLLIVPDSHFRQSWFEDLNAYLGFSAANLSRVCKDTSVLQHQFRLTHLFWAILSSQEFRHRLCRREEDALNYLKDKTNEARSITTSLKKMGKCLERTLIDIFTQSFRFPNPKVFCLRDDEQLQEENKPLDFDPWVSGEVTPAAEAVELLSRLTPLVRRSINTLDFTGNLLFSRYFGDDRKTSEELSNVLTSCCQGIPKRDWGIRHIIIDDKISGIGDLPIDLNIEISFFTSLLSLQRTIERLNLRGVKSLNYDPLSNVLPTQLKELRVSSMSVSDEIFPFFEDGLETLDIDWEKACVEEADDPGDENAPGFGEGPLDVDEDKVTSALTKSGNTLQELRMTYASIVGRFLTEAGLYHLKKLHLRYCTSLDENYLISFFEKAEQLEDIDLSGSNTNGVSLASIKDSVKKLSLRRCSHLDPVALGVFLETKAQSLEVLHVDFATIAGAFKSIPELPKLKEFSFFGGSFDDEGEVQTILDKCPNLDRESKEYLQDELDCLRSADDEDADMAEN